MNAVEIESAISELALQPFDTADFPFAFLAAFGSKDTALKRLRAGNNNGSDMAGGVLLRNNIHIAVCEAGTVGETLKALRASPATTKAKSKFILATDGQTLEAEELITGETITCEYLDFPNHFGFLLPLAGISTIKEIKDNPIDVRATSRLNKLYVELLNENPDWAKTERRADMNHFMARLVFCFFAEDTDIFIGDSLFTRTMERYSERDGSNTHQVLSEIFRAMNIKDVERTVAQPRLPSWANSFPYVNGGLFSGSTEVPRFTRMARTYLLHAGNLNWKKINPDIFGSMIQAVADDEERSALGMHYTSVPNILKVLKPLFLDDLCAQLQAAGDNKSKLLNLRKRMARIRVFDPACGSGNFLVIAYKHMRDIEAEINRRRGESNNKSEIPLTNFRGIELRDFPAEIARLALIIAEFQCDVLYRGQQDALAEFLPLNAQNWIVCGNALRLDWLSICPPTGTGVKVLADDLFGTPLNQTEIDFENEGGETYICGNPPYLGSRDQKDEQKADLQTLFDKRVQNWKSLDYVAGWFIKAADYGTKTRSAAAFVSTNSICQGLQVPTLWPEIFANGRQIEFAHTSFRWTNLASHNAGVTVVIIGITTQPRNPRRLFTLDNLGQTIERQCAHINAYLAAGDSVIVDKISRPLGTQSEMTFGNTPIDGGHLLLSRDERDALQLTPAQQGRFIRRIYGSAEFIRGLERYCLWIEDHHLAEAQTIPPIAQRLRDVRNIRLNGGKTARDIAERPHQFQRMYFGKHSTLIVPREALQ
ncbi:putative DNA methylase, partial [Pseudomonas syringae pv. spinaceae]